MNLLTSINSTRLQVIKGFDGGDNHKWEVDGVPGASLDTYNEKYFYFHHSKGKF